MSEWSSSGRLFLHSHTRKQEKDAVVRMPSLYHRLTPSELVPVIDEYVVAVKEYFKKLKQGNVQENILTCLQSYHG